MSTAKSTNGNGPVAIITAIGTLATTLGTVIVIVITAAQHNTIKQVEKQGNSVALEQKRVTSEALRAKAETTKLPKDELKASDAEKLYEEAVKAAERDAR